MKRDLMPIPGYRHPSASAYNAGCGCEKCKAHRRRKGKLVKMYGSSRVDAAPVVAKVQQLVAEGYPRTTIAKASGVSARNLTERTLNDRTTVTKTTSDAILNLTRMDIIRQANPESLMPSTGAARRLRALMAMGWRLQDLATTTSEFHLYNSIRSQHDHRVRVDSHLLIANLYDKYSMRKGPSQLNVAKSKRLGYAPPMAWTDIDDPASTPDLGSTDYDPYAAFVEDAIHLWELNVEPEAILRRTGATASAGASRFRRLQPDHPLLTEFNRIAKRKKRAA